MTIMLKKLFVFLILSIFLNAANIDTFASKFDFFRSYDQAILHAKKNNKPLMIVLSADYCPWCRKFERKTLSHPIIQQYLQANYICLIVDKTHEKNMFPTHFSTQITPRIFFVEPIKQTIVHETAGYLKVEPFLKELDIAFNLLHGHK